MPEAFTVLLTIVVLCQACALADLYGRLGMIGTARLWLATAGFALVSVVLMGVLP